VHGHPHTPTHPYPHPYNQTHHALSPHHHVTHSPPHTHAHHVRAHNQGAGGGGGYPCTPSHHVHGPPYPHSLAHVHYPGLMGGGERDTYASHTGTAASRESVGVEREMWGVGGEGGGWREREGGQDRGRDTEGGRGRVRRDTHAYTHAHAQRHAHHTHTLNAWDSPSRVFDTLPPFSSTHPPPSVTNLQHPSFYFMPPATWGEDGGGEGRGGVYSAPGWAREVDGVSVCDDDALSLSFSLERERRDELCAYSHTHNHLNSHTHANSHARDIQSSTGTPPHPPKDGRHVRMQSCHNVTRMNTSCYTCE